MSIQLVAGTTGRNAYLIPQKWTVRSLKGGEIGTANLFNCMGIVLHSPAHGIGCVGHIEAQGYDNPYAATFDQFIRSMIAEITRYGGADANLQLALFGNTNGTPQATFTQAVRIHAIAAGVPAAEILDQRNHAPGGGTTYDAGSLARPVNGMNISGITYAPARGPGLVRYFAGLGRPVHYNGWINWGITSQQIQP